MHSTAAAAMIAFTCAAYSLTILFTKSVRCSALMSHSRSLLHCIGCFHPRPHSYDATSLTVDSYTLYPLLVRSRQSLHAAYCGGYIHACLNRAILACEYLRLASPTVHSHTILLAILSSPCRGNRVRNSRFRATTRDAEPLLLPTRSLLLDCCHCQRDYVHPSTVE